MGVEIKSVEVQRFGRLYTVGGFAFFEDEVSVQFSFEDDHVCSRWGIPMEHMFLYLEGMSKPDGSTYRITEDKFAENRYALTVSLGLGDNSDMSEAEVMESCSRLLVSYLGRLGMMGEADYVELMRTNAAYIRTASQEFLDVLFGFYHDTIAYRHRVEQARLRGIRV